MGSEESDPCWKKIVQKNGKVVNENICATKTLSITGIIGPKFRVTISGHPETVDDIVNAYMNSLGQAS